MKAILIGDTLRNTRIGETYRVRALGPLFGGCDEAIDRTIVLERTRDREIFTRSENVLLRQLRDGTWKEGE